VRSPKVPVNQHYLHTKAPKRYIRGDGFGRDFYRFTRYCLTNYILRGREQA